MARVTALGVISSMVIFGVAMGATGCSGSSEPDCAAPTLSTDHLQMQIDTKPDGTPPVSEWSGIIDFEGGPPGLLIPASNGTNGLSWSGVPIQAGTWTFRGRDLCNNPDGTQSRSSDVTITVDVADRPAECASDTDCAVIAGSQHACTKDGDCDNTSIDKSCAKLDIGGGRCWGGGVAVCGSCTHSVDLTDTSGATYQNCAAGSSAQATCNERQHCIPTDQAGTCS